MKYTKPMIILATAFFAMSNYASAHEGHNTSNAGYATDAKGHLEISANGECIKTSAWTPERALAGCGDGPVKSVKAAVKTVRVEPAPAIQIQKLDLKAGALFDVNKATLKGAGKTELDELAAKLRRFSKLEAITVIGHTDNLGDDSYNQSLSQRRAESVKSYLISQGISSDLIKTMGMGESKPVANNATASGRAQNRRVALEIEAQESKQ